METGKADHESGDAVKRHRPALAYVVSRFPHLTETFILRELVELSRRGWRVSLYPILIQRQPLVQEQADAWLAAARDLSLLSPALLAANVRTLFTQPATLAGTWLRAVRENAASPGFLARTLVLLPKATYAARLMKAEGIEHVHAHYATHPALMAWVIHRLTGIPYSVTAHAHDIFVNRSMLATKLRDARFVVAISDFNRAYLEKALGPWVTEKTHVVRCGVIAGTGRARREGVVAGGPVRDLQRGQPAGIQGLRAPGGGVRAPARPAPAVPLPNHRAG